MIGNTSFNVGENLLVNSENIFAFISSAVKCVYHDEVLSLIPVQNVHSRLSNASVKRKSFRNLISGRINPIPTSYLLGIPNKNSNAVHRN